MPRFFATVAKGIEPVTAQELVRLGATKIEPTYGGVYFDGSMETLYRANLWLRTATRILMPMREFSAQTPEMLYDQVRRINWDNYLNPDLTFAVDCTIAGAKSLKRGQDDRNDRSEAPEISRFKSRPPRVQGGLNHSRYAALKIKDAIVDQLRLKYGSRPNVDTERPDLKIVAYLNSGRCMISLDSSGPSLHERGYRLEGASAPLKETLAAAIVELSGWDPKTAFVDPMCGSGTLPLEASLKGMNIAPGLFRDRFGFETWPDFDKATWLKLINEAKEAVLKRPLAPIMGFDRDRDAVATALENSKRAGLTRIVHFERRSIETLEKPKDSESGTLIVNPPYGERLGDVEELQGLYKLLGDLFKQRMKGYNCFIFTGNLELAKHVGLRASRRIELFNGPIECRLLRYEMY